MSKAILILDMPRSCAECTLRTSLEANYLYCIATLPRLKIDPMTVQAIKEHKCPLKPMPKEKQICMDMDEIIWDDDIYNLGYNKCLHDITGETE